MSPAFSGFPSSGRGKTSPCEMFQTKHVTDTIQGCPVAESNCQPNCVERHELRKRSLCPLSSPTKVSLFSCTTANCGHFIHLAVRAEGKKLHVGTRVSKTQSLAKFHFQAIHMKIHVLKLGSFSSPLTVTFATTLPGTFHDLVMMVVMTVQTFLGLPLWPDRLPSPGRTGGRRSMVHPGDLPEGAGRAQ